MWFTIIKGLQRIALSKNDKITQENKRQVEERKPDGLWYSFSLGSGWMRRNMVDYGWLGSYKYILQLDTSALNILQIKNLEDAKDFTEKFGLRISPSKVIAKWNIVAYTYDGIELLNYRTWVQPKFTYDTNIERDVMAIFNGWDMDSGCIWNTQNLKVKKVKPIEKRHYAKQYELQNAWRDY